MKRISLVVLIVLALLSISTQLQLMVLHNTSGEARAIRLGEEMYCEMEFLRFENNFPCYLDPGDAMEFGGITDSGVALWLGTWLPVTMNARCMTAYNMRWAEWEEAHKNGTLEGGWKVACDD